MLDALRYVNFTAAGTPDDPRSRCQRYAVLTPIYGPVDRRAVAHAVLDDSGDGLVYRWRRALATYRDPEFAGWEDGSRWPARIASRLNALVNCRPTFIA